MNLHRPTLGILAIVLLGLAAAIWFFAPDTGYSTLYTALLRVGTVLAVLWLALPDTKPLANRLLIAGILLTAVVFVVRPGLILLAIKHPLVVGIVGGAIFLLKILRPRRPNPGTQTDRKNSPAREPKRD